MTDTNLYQSPDSEILSSDTQVADNMRLFSVSQRIGRLRYLAYSTGVYFVSGIVFAIFGAVGVFSGYDFNAMSTTGFVASILLYIVVLIAFAIVGIRRLHDLDKSGWLYLIFFVPLVNIVFALYLIFASGTEGANRFGPEPRPNHIGIWIAGLVLPVVFVLGIVAAIALPAYQSYIDRAQQEQYQQD